MHAAVGPRIAADFELLTSARDLDEQDERSKGQQLEEKDRLEDDKRRQCVRYSLRQNEVARGGEDRAAQNNVIGDEGMEKAIHRCAVQFDALTLADHARQGLRQAQGEAALTCFELALNDHTQVLASFQRAHVNLTADKSRELLQGNHAGGYHILGQPARAMHA